MTNRKIIAISTTHEPGTFGWRHLLAWRQLSIFWRIGVLHCLSANSFSRSQDTVCSVAIRYGESSDNFVRQCQRFDSPVVTFLDRACLSDATDGSPIKFVDYLATDDRFRHVYQLEQSHPLLDGLPRTVSIYGRGPTVTPLRVESGMEILVSLHGVPVIALHRRHLLIGADPWQLGHPSVPMLYKLLSNWLVHEGIKLRKLRPFAVIRLDDLPATGENLRLNPPTKGLDRARCKSVKRLRHFARRHDIKFTLMYSSHFANGNGAVVPISTVMPRSIRQMQVGVKQQVFELGSHGMVHLRDWSDFSGTDPREFADLDAEQTATHLASAEEEIIRLFGDRPLSFVAPAWGYRPGVTKRVAAERYQVVIDSSQHVETGLADVFGKARQDDRRYFNMVETFRSGDRMLSYSSADFWSCYAAAGIPVHYMQHTDTNWHILKNFLESKTDSKAERLQTRIRSRFLQVAQDTRQPRWIRVFSAAAISLLCWFEPSSWRPLWMMLTSSSLYAFIRAVKLGGYQCVTLSELMTFITREDDPVGLDPANCNQSHRI